jgi:hypothetical protein
VLSSLQVVGRDYLHTTHCHHDVGRSQEAFN